MKSLTACACLFSFVLACGGSTTDIGDSGSDGGPTNDATTKDTSTSDVAVADGQGPPDTGNGDSSAPCGAKAVNLTFANCPTQPTCGGTIVDGIYDYTTGCIPTPWAQAQQNCPTLKVSNEQGTVQGCITFAGNLATRDVQSSYSATLAVPSSCLFNSTCTQLQGYLTQAGLTATCAASTGGCTCNVSSSYAGTGATTYTATNNQVVTSTNNHYDYCMGTGTIDMQWVSGPNAEPGVYTLTKQ